MVRYVKLEYVAGGASWSGLGSADYKMIQEHIVRGRSDWRTGAFASPRLANCLVYQSHTSTSRTEVVLERRGYGHAFLAILHKTHLGPVRPRADAVCLSALCTVGWPGAAYAKSQRDRQIYDEGFG